MARVTKIVEALERRHEEAMSLLGDIVATLTLPRNVEVLQGEGPGGKVIAQMGGEWSKRFKELEARS
jgi:hypothetical protein